ncbi:S41 family peptidase [Aquimarina sp. ERC-38]|uniref:S41 family peptidase n=1 Tax=Aquimarina sp. ERC-38 TaxID=2949996 RepID=UPI00224810F3|nr:S41 family peptidase [Aquimarina sp. ERC-38]UZO79656.1 S41 family peptidase [Aquimarina sp. ERC-38]
MQNIIILLLVIISQAHTYSQNLTKEKIKTIIYSIPELIESNYVDKEKGKQIAIDFKHEMNSGKYYSIRNSDTLVNVLSKDLKRISKDGHMYINHLKASDTKTAGTKDWEAQEKALEIKLNYGFTEIQILENNTGYIKIVEFMQPKRSMQTAVAAMKMVENTENLIIDIRDNGGGYPGVLEYIINHYFDGPPTLLSTTYFSDPKMTAYTKYTSDLVYGKLRIGKPLYILINGNTGSASEYFAYTLQAFGKAIIIGEKSAGSAHNNEYFSLSDNFRISISTAMPVNEITKTNWERKGVIPDVNVKSESAKKKAIEIILNKK